MPAVGEAQTPGGGGPSASTASSAKDDLEAAAAAHQSQPEVLGDLEPDELEEAPDDYNASLVQHEAVRFLGTNAAITPSRRGRAPQDAVRKKNPTTALKVTGKEAEAAAHAAGDAD